MGELHHLNVGCGDASCIVTDATFLIDTHEIGQHSHVLPKSKHIRGIFITHQHRDHYSGLEFLLNNNYSVEYIIYSPYDRRYSDPSVSLEEWNEFGKLRDKFAERGTELLTAYCQETWDKPFWDTNGVRFWMLGPKKSTANDDSRELHDACLVIKAHLGNRKCIFTGDASDKNLQDVAGIDHICDDILHASHHGSIEGADLGFIKKCGALYTVISTQAGVHDNVPHPTALKRYRDNTKNEVYRTDEFGSVNWSF